MQRNHLESIVKNLMCTNITVQAIYVFVCMYLPVSLSIYFCLLCCYLFYFYYCYFYNHVYKCTVLGKHNCIFSNIDGAKEFVNLVKCFMNTTISPRKMTHPCNF